MEKSFFCDNFLHLNSIKKDERLEYVVVIQYTSNV